MLSENIDLIWELSLGSTFLYKAEYYVYKRYILLAGAGAS